MSEKRCPRCERHGTIPGGLSEALCTRCNGKGTVPEWPGLVPIIEAFLFGEKTKG